ncbi:MAG: neutral/alkaline non-lysosomal ceramidase N-terminal domain-containing protein [Candidatus Latescibacter sp.]|nr:neutral/alkaline non-lysosomal ceramidase N-terminal domain-containing protein [Candidatus Latescibacter sp.]
MKNDQTYQTGVFRWFIGICFSISLLYPLSALCAPAAAEWKAGVASAVTTPDAPVWMAGYGNRKEPSQGKISDIYVKALALQDPQGTRAVIVTADIVGYGEGFTAVIAAEVKKRFGIPREAILFNASHTHCGPEIRPEKERFINITPEYASKLEIYKSGLQKKFVQVISEAIKGLQPAQLSYSTGNPVPFAVSRRFPTDKGIVYRSTPSSYYTGGSRDDVVPVLKVADSNGAIRAILFGYACHPITLSVDYISGDYPGFAQQYIQEMYPGATALFVQGCSGELVPNARYQVEYAMGHGKALAEAVKKALAGNQKLIVGPLKCAYQEVTLDCQPVPDRKTLEENRKSSNLTLSRKSAFFLDKIARGEKIQESVPCPLQVLHFGKELLFIGIGGETVVDYAVNLKSEFKNPNQPVWVAGYCNYVFGYLPTLKILKEGGYEGGDALLHTQFSGPFSEKVEDQVMGGIRKLVAKVSE